MSSLCKGLTKAIIIFGLASILACKKDNLDPIGEPVVNDFGEIVSDNKWRGKLDSGFVSITHSDKDGAFNGMIIVLHGTNLDSLASSNITIVYHLPPEKTVMPEGEFTLRGEDFFTYYINISKSFNHTDDYGERERQMVISLHKLKGSRYSIKWSGSVKDKTISGQFTGDLPTYTF